MKIAFGNDQYGLAYKEAIMAAYPEHEYVDCGAYNTDSVSYPPIAEAVSRMVASGEADRGILICGTGIGMAMSANKVRGAYAAVCHDIYSTQRSILSNDANIMCMGALVIGMKTAETLAGEWLSLTFDKSSASAPKVADLRSIEERF